MARALIGFHSVGFGAELRGCLARIFQMSQRRPSRILSEWNGFDPSGSEWIRSKFSPYRDQFGPLSQPDAKNISHPLEMGPEACECPEVTARSKPLETHRPSCEPLESLEGTCGCLVGERVFMCDAFVGHSRFSRFSRLDAIGQQFEFAKFRILCLRLNFSMLVCVFVCLCVYYAFGVCANRLLEQVCNFSMPSSDCVELEWIQGNSIEGSSCFRSLRSRL